MLRFNSLFLGYRVYLSLISIHPMLRFNKIMCVKYFTFRDISIHPMLRFNVEEGHDGSVHVLSDFNRKIDIEEIYKKIYDKYMIEYQHKGNARVKATDKIYDLCVFKYTKYKE